MIELPPLLPDLLKVDDFWGGRPEGEGNVKTCFLLDSGVGPTNLAAKPIEGENGDASSILGEAASRWSEFPPYLLIQKRLASSSLRILLISTSCFGDVRTPLNRLMSIYAIGGPLFGAI